jgi:putative endonuclease
MNDPDMTVEVADAELEVATAALAEANDAKSEADAQAAADTEAMAEVTGELQDAAAAQQTSLEDALAAGYTMEEILAYLESQGQADERQTSSRRSTQADDDNPLLKLFDAQKAVMDLLASATAVVADAQASTAAASRAEYQLKQQTPAQKRRWAADWPYHA